MKCTQRDFAGREIKTTFSRTMTQESIKPMQIERTNKEVIIRLPASFDTKGLQSLIDYLAYKEATNTSQASQADVDTLVKTIKKGQWLKNKKRFVK